ncbi:MAG: hypothetical protein MUC88_03000 [Planctomycetes bacterium]|jgi:hypothetical protein|nr:hypothetical protein [Planctomycetota bacterium]
MTNDYSIEVCRQLQERFAETQVRRPMRIGRYEPGTELTYRVHGFPGDRSADVHVAVERFVGGGFAGQVYRVQILQIDGSEIAGLRVGSSYAMKILVPPSGFSRLCRNLLYRIGFQGPFQLQVNPAAARAGALWQKLIRRGARIQFGDERTVVDIYGTFVDQQIGSCGELSEWVEGRTWRLEVDDRLDLLRQWRRGRIVDSSRLGSPEYRAKKVFMHEFVGLLHEMGAHEFARQYEWSTCKSQPNCLKRRSMIADSGGDVNPPSDLDKDPAAGLVAVDFRAGLALLPFLPMSPGDVKLILQGVARGSLVQFDRGRLDQLDRFIAAHRAEFADMQGILTELKEAERIYRDSVPDLTHNHVRLLTSSRLWTTMRNSAITGWQTRGLVDEEHARSLRGSRVLTLAFLLVGCIPFLGKVLRRAWGRSDWREHYVRLLTGLDYLRRAFHARMAERLTEWHRAARVDSQGATRLAGDPWRFLAHCPLSILPAGLHRAVTDWQFAREKVAQLLIHPIRLYFNAQLREQWLRDMVAEGQSKHMLSDEDAGTILSQIQEPYIQKYLKCLAVHLCTLFVTELTALTLAIVYVLMHSEMPWQQAWGRALTIIALFQIVPVSPGSLVRGVYVLYVVIREHNFRDYNIAVFVGFFRYIGYLAFPIQMTYRYPVLARFMAAHWATEAVHVVPVFGERGALLEHWVFYLFYNWPLTIRRRMRRRAEMRALMPPRYWHVPACVLVATAAFGLLDSVHLARTGALPGLRAYWWLLVAIPLLCGSIAVLGCGGATLGRRILAAALAGVLTALATTLILAILGRAQGIAAAHALAIGFWRTFLFTILATIGAILTELTLPEPEPALPEPVAG